MYYKNYYTKLNSSQHISSPNSSLFLSVFKFPSPNNRFHLFINSILLLIGILWNLVPFFLLFPLYIFNFFFTRTVQQKQPLILFPWFHRQVVGFFPASHSLLCSLLHIPWHGGLGSTHNNLLLKAHILNRNQTHKMFYMGSQSGGTVCDIKYSLKGGSLLGIHLAWI